jgi:hypothetical protein
MTLPLSTTSITFMSIACPSVSNYRNFRNDVALQRGCIDLEDEKKEMQKSVPYPLLVN